MGILDDAIREHLELKRKHGAEQEDLERLEKEAFGPAERPGEPDSRELELEDLDGEAAEAAEAETRVQSLEDWSDEQEEDSEPGLSGAEQGRSDHPDLGATVDHPVVEPDRDEEPPEPPEAAIFDGGEDLELDDLDLELEVEDEDEPPRPSEPSTISSGGDDFDFEVPEPPATEHPLPAAPDAADEGVGEVAGAEAESEEMPLDFAGADEDLEDDEDPAFGEEEPAAEADEDLLEETPDFLQDTPEGERLWFEQGKPRDFDFDD